MNYGKNGLLGSCKRSSIREKRALQSRRLSPADPVNPSNSSTSNPFGGGLGARLMHTSFSSDHEVKKVTHAPLFPCRTHEYEYGPKHERLRRKRGIDLNLCCSGNTWGVMDRPSPEKLLSLVAGRVGMPRRQ